MFYFFNLLTAPGVVVHELAHALFCVLSRVKVYRVVLFRFGNPAGFVEHAEPRAFWEHMLISFGPLIVNSLAAMVLFARLVTPWLTWQNAVFIWLGIAFGVNAIPSVGDAKSLWLNAKKRVWRNPLVLIGFPIIAALYGLNILKRWHLPILYAIFLFWLSRFYLRS